MHKLNDIPLDRLLVEHYIFDLGQSVEKTAEILDKDEQSVREIHDDYVKIITPIRRNK